MTKSKATTSQLWLERIFDSDLSGHHKLVAAYLASIMFGNTASAWPSAPTITKNVGWSERKVRDCLNDLIEQKWLTVKGLHRSGTRILAVSTPAQCATPAQHAPAPPAPLHPVLPPPAHGATESVSESVRTTSTRFKPPTLEELTEYCKEKNHTFDPEKFMAHYETVGWKVGRNPMKNWKSATTTWQKRERPNGQNQQRNETSRKLSGAERTRRAREAQRLQEGANTH